MSEEKIIQSDEALVILSALGSDQDPVWVPVEECEHCGRPYEDDEYEEKCVHRVLEDTYCSCVSEEIVQYVDANGSKVTGSILDMIVDRLGYEVIKS